MLHSNPVVPFLTTLPSLLAESTEMLRSRQISKVAPPPSFCIQSQRNHYFGRSELRSGGGVKSETADNGRPQPPPGRPPAQSPAVPSRPQPSPSRPLAAPSRPRPAAWLLAAPGLPPAVQKYRIWTLFQGCVFRKYIVHIFKISEI